MKSRATKKDTTNSNTTKDSFLKKIQFCMQTFDFEDESKNVKEKEERLKYLNEFIEYISNQSLMQTHIIPNIDNIMEIIKINIFRPLPVVKKQGIEGEMAIDAEETILDPSWPHLQPVFEIFLQLIVSDEAEMKILKSYINSRFIQEFLELFDSEEPKEREYLKNILHRLYAKLVPRRRMIRKAITETFYNLIHEGYKFNGAPELLDILAAIISGFAVPLREEHVYFFKNVIIPLHKVQTSFKYHSELIRCTMLFLSKDPSLALPIIDGLLKYWPFANYTKETAFLGELLDILEICCEFNQLEPLAKKLFLRIITCLSSPHIQVSDRTMCFFENDYFLSILKHFKNIAFPILVPVIAHYANNHWHKIIQDSFCSLKNILSDIDSSLYESCLQTNNPECLNLIKQPEEIKTLRNTTEDKWEMLLKEALSINKNLKVPNIPYKDTHIIGHHNRLFNGDPLVID